MTYQPPEAPVTRVAPSPTGDPHVGTAYTALFNYALARRHGGRFLLRIEDTDQARSTAASEQSILESLRWLGLQWDEGPDVGGPNGPYRQSERTALYREHAEELIERGGAYRCFCTPERLAELRSKPREGQRAGYDGLCRTVSVDEGRRRAAGGESHVVRLRMPLEGRTVVSDLVRGDVVFDNATVDDQVLLKSDGFPTYHLANVVDDHLMGVNHVMRGEEWLPSAPKHLVLYDALGWAPPVLCHLPLLRNPDRSKLSKRKNPTSIGYFRRLGVMPRGLLNFLALMGWAMPDGNEFFSLDEMVAEFDPTRISTGGPVFDLVKLLKINGRVIRETLTAEELHDELRSWLLNDEYLGSMVPLVHQRLESFSEFVPRCQFLFSGSVEPDAAEMVPEGREQAETLEALTVASAVLEDLEAWTADAVDAVLRRAAEAHGWPLRDFLAPLFVAISGSRVSPPLFLSMEVLGKDLGVVRLREAREALGTLGRKKQVKLLKRFRKVFDALGE